MTDWSVGAVALGGVDPGCGVAGSAGTPASRSVSASAMVGEGRAGYFAIDVWSAVADVPAAAVSAVAAATAAAIRCSTSAWVYVPGADSGAAGAAGATGSVVFGVACAFRVFGTGVVSTLSLTAS